MPDPTEDDMLREARRLDRAGFISYEEATGKPNTQVKVENWEDMMRELRDIKTQIANLVTVLSSRGDGG